MCWSSSGPCSFDFFSLLPVECFSDTTEDCTHTVYFYTRDRPVLYRGDLQRRMWAAEPVYTVEEITTLLTEILHGAAAEAYPHTQPDQRRRSGSIPQNSWYDDECKEMRSQIQSELVRGIITYKQSRIALRRLVTES